jgi:hypothetical protein
MSAAKSLRSVRSVSSSRIAEEFPKSIEHQLRSLIDDPVPDVVNRLDLEIGHSFFIAAQQCRGDHWVLHPVQPAHWDIDTCVRIFTAQPTELFPALRSAVPA